MDQRRPILQPLLQQMNALARRLRPILIADRQPHKALVPRVQEMLDWPQVYQIQVLQLLNCQVYQVHQLVDYAQDQLYQLMDQPQVQVYQIPILQLLNCQVDPLEPTPLNSH
jgi:hypothetical protein